jgi:hypothetical protein
MVAKTPGAAKRKMRRPGGMASPSFGDPALALIAR